jgi:hypothetical protein
MKAIGTAAISHAGSLPVGAIWASGLFSGIFHIPSNFVVDQWASDGESRSHRDFLVLHDV